MQRQSKRKVILVLVVLMTASVMWSDWLTYKTRAEANALQVTLSKEETERVKTLVGVE